MPCSAAVAPLAARWLSTSHSASCATMPPRVRDRFSESMTLLTWWLGLPPLNVTCRANVFAHAANEATLSTEAERAVLADNALDLRLYGEGVELWEARWELMHARSPWRIKADRYTCRNTTRSTSGNPHRTSATICVNLVGERALAGTPLLP